MKYIDAEKLKRLVGELKMRAKRNRCDSWGIVPDALEEVEGFITSLQQEQPEVDLEKEMDKFYGIYRDENGMAYDCETHLRCLDWKDDEDEDQKLPLARHFYELDRARKEESVSIAESPSKTFPRVNEFDCGSSYRH